jgi:hypothetical protein
MWQNILIAVIVLLCAIYVGRKLFRQARGQSGCGCGCSGGCTPPAVTGPGKGPGDPPAGCDCGGRQ